MHSRWKQESLQQPIMSVWCHDDPYFLLGKKKSDLLRALPLCDLREGQRRRLRRHPRRSLLLCPRCSGGGRKELRRGKHTASVQTMESAACCFLLQKASTLLKKNTSSSGFFILLILSLLSCLTTMTEIDAASLLTGKLKNKI